MELKPAGKSGKVRAQIEETTRLSRYTAEAKKAAKDAENSAQRAETALTSKQDRLVSGVNIRTVNGQSILGSGNIMISGDGSSIAIDDELSDTSTNAVQNRIITEAVREIERALNAPPPIGLGMTGATAGQVPVVKTVDENGVPTSYEPGADSGGLPSGGAAGQIPVKASAANYAVKWATAALHISVASFSSFPQTISNSAITAGMRVVNCVWGTPSAVTSAVTWTTTNGSLTLSGNISGSTTAGIDLILF